MKPDEVEKLRRSLFECCVGGGGGLLFADLDTASLDEEASEARGAGGHALPGLAADRSGSPPARVWRVQSEFVGLGGMMRDCGTWGEIRGARLRQNWRCCFRLLSFPRLFGKFRESGAAP